MKIGVTILAAGSSERMGNQNKLLLLVNNKPILLHIMNIYSKYGYNDFCLALGYKAELINNYLLSNGFKKIDNDASAISLDSIQMVNDKLSVTTVNTGLNTMTGGRLKRLRKLIGNDTFMLTYGDGVCDLDVNELIKFHKSHKKMVTVTAVHPIARFGELIIENNMVVNFREKPQTNNDWINGGFFVINPEFIDLIDSDETIMEREPLEKISAMNELMAYKYPGFWQCMDTKRDKDRLEELINKNEAKWI